MKVRKYVCGAKPLGAKGGPCGADPREHNIRQNGVISPITGRILPQHTFVPRDKDKDES